MVGVDAAVAKEGPVTAGFFALSGIAFNDEDFFFVVRGFGENAAEGIGDERVAPEFEAGVTCFGFALEADPINDRDVNAVGDCVGALDGAPSVELGGAELSFFVGMPADAGGIKNYLRALQSSEARAFRIPLIPANLNADAAVNGVEIWKAEIAGREIEFFVVQRIIGDVHFAIFAEERAVGVDDGAGVVINAGGAAFEKRNDQNDLFFFCDLCEGVSGGAGNRLREIEKIGIFGAAKIFAAEKFIHANDLGAARGGFADFFDGARKIFAGIGGAAHLHEANCEFVCHKI